MTTAIEADMPPKIVVCVPAHNEQPRIHLSLDALAEQTWQPTRTIAVDDRSTDSTAKVARQYPGVEVWATSNNEHRKAGAIEQALRRLLPTLDGDDLVVITDADTELAPRFIQAAVERIQRPLNGTEKPVGAVGALFLGEPVKTLAQCCQSLEYFRYRWDVVRRHGRAEVVSGTGGVFPVKVLRAVAIEYGHCFDPTSFTEDFHLTLAIKHLGYRTASPAACTVTTELPATWQALRVQRLRWQRGAISTLRRFGLSRITAPYIARQVLIYTGALFPFLFTTTWLLAYLTGHLPFAWVWMLASLAVAIERVRTAQLGGWRAMGFAALVIPELLADLWHHTVFLRALGEELLGASEKWRGTSRVSLGQFLKRNAVAGVLAASTCLLAVVLHVAGVGWAVVATMVLAGVGHSLLRASGYDPLLRVHGSAA